jgi:carboxypeptidase C (cathepsin A)
MTTSRPIAAIFASVFAVILYAVAPASADDAPAKGQGHSSGGSVLSLLPKDAVTEHTLTINGAPLSYTATAGTLDLFGQDGQRTAAIFYTSYVAKSANGERRPLTFVFNGGPGAASAFLNLGLVGPKVADFGKSGHDGAAAHLVDNPASWLAFTDLVLIDPVGSGWSRTEKPDQAKGFYGVNADAQMFAKVIALYTAHNARTASPKYLVGESYGGLRAIKVARVLQNDQGIVVSGIVALSPLLEGRLMFGANRFALGAALHLPSLAAAELERKKTFSRDALASAERFAMTDYLTTLAGPPLQGEAARSFYARVAQVSGLPADVVARSRGFIGNAYVKHSQESRGLVVSPYDATIAIPDPFPESDGARNDDPVLDGFVRALGGLYAGYARNELNFKTEMTYTLLASDVAHRWDWDGAGGSLGNASVTSDIGEFLALNPTTKLMIAHGYSDMVTPYGVSRYIVDHLPPVAPGRVTLSLYRGGHMFYLDPASRLAFGNDVKTFYGVAE